MKIIRIKDGVTRMESWRMRRPVDFCLEEGEHIAIVGPNGGGKSMLADIITGRHPLAGTGVEYHFPARQSNLASDNIKLINFRDAYADSDSNYFLQQRWNQTEMDATAPTVGEVIEKALAQAGEDNAEGRSRLQQLLEVFDFQTQTDKQVVMLSSGEMRKLQLVKALLSHPRVLMMDNPFIGLDAAARSLLRQLLRQLTETDDVQLILILPDMKDVPRFITHVVEVSDMTVGKKFSLDEYLGAKKDDCHQALPDEKQRVICSPRSMTHDEQGSTTSDTCSRHEIIVSMDDVSIRYGTRTILDHLSWTIRRGEHWALTGPNGSGKSTLLSLVCADNPQGYACNITLFGRQRGSGESIWDIKKHIGYVSPEMHRAYQRDLPAINVVASGLHDSVGLYVKPKEELMETCRAWMMVFGLEGKEKESFTKLSSGEQRLALLARAFVKSPDLLILDEPLHGLDEQNKEMVKDIIDTYCQQEDKTLIMVTHYMEDLPSCIDHSQVLKRTT